MKKRVMHSKSFKSKVVLEALKGEMTIAEICSRYEVGSSRVHLWKKQALEGLPELFEKSRARSSKVATEDELNSLYEQIGRLKVENDYFKKKLAL